MEEGKKLDCDDLPDKLSALQISDFLFIGVNQRVYSA